MALPSTGSISFAQINTEIKRTSTNALSLNDATVRALAGKTSGAISMSDLRGKSYEIRYVNSTNRTNASIYSLMGSPTAAGNYIFENTAVISAGSGSFALRTGTFPAGSTLRIINRGTIRGCGGNGGSVAGTAGGTALYIDMTCTLDNSGGTISGGGGGGAGISGRQGSGNVTYRAGGGGGAGVNAGASGSNSSSSYQATTRTPAAGTATAGGAGGIVHYLASSFFRLTGGNGGERGAKGGTGSYSGTATISSRNNGTAGAAGRAIQLNGKTVTIINAGTRHGATS